VYLADNAKYKGGSNK